MKLPPKIPEYSRLSEWPRFASILLEALDDRLVPKEPTRFKKTLCRQLVEHVEALPAGQQNGIAALQAPAAVAGLERLLAVSQEYERGAVERELADSERAVLNDICRGPDFRARDQRPHQAALRHRRHR